MQLFGERLAAMLARVLSGTPPAATPIESPTYFELAVNLGRVRALGLTLPANLLARAGTVVE
jgi:putative ABC transport system substrate-binding protein